MNMKKLSLLIALLCVLNANAYDIKVDGIYYDINLNTMTASVVRGVEGIYFTQYSGDIIIPSTIEYNGYVFKVTSINTQAFDNCPELCSITIPSNITKIQQYAFSLCTNIKSVIITDSESKIEIGKGQFKASPFNYLYIGRDIGDTSISDLVHIDETIDGGYKDHNSSLTTLVVSEQVKKVGKLVHCTNLMSVTCLSTNPKDVYAVFSNRTYMDGILYVPIGTIEKYKQVDGWKQFFNIVEKDFSNGIISVKTNTTTGKVYYNIKGQKFNEGKHGLNIIRETNGKTRKVFIK